MNNDTTSAFQVKIASSDQLIDIPVGESIVDVLESHGIDITVSCEQGICGTCLTGVIDGVPEHKDVFMTDEEHAANDMITPCCSRSLTPILTLDL